MRDQYVIQKPHATTKDIAKFKKKIHDEFTQSKDIYTIETDRNLIDIYERFRNLSDSKIIAEFVKIKQKKDTTIHEQIKYILNSLPEKLASKLQLNKSLTYYCCITLPYTYTYSDASYVEMPVGSYELADIEKKVNDLLEPILKGFKFTAHLDKVTLKCALQCTHRLFGFYYENSVAGIFGFADTQVLLPNTLTVSNSCVNIMPINVIKIDCNIISGSYSNGAPVHTLHEFYPTVGIGYKIVDVPHNVIYLPITVRSISNIRVRAVDQDGNLIDFRGETITLRIHIKKI